MALPPLLLRLEPFKPYIVERLTDYPSLTATRLLLELRDRGYAHSVTIVQRYVAKVRAPRAKKAYLRVETEPGEVAQVDWGSFGHMRIGNTQRPLSAFAIVLKWSRVLYVDFSLDQRMDTFLRMHARAFAFLGGIPKKVIYDNLKSVVLHHVGTTVQFNPAFLAFAGQMLFEPVAAPVRYPQAKGNVENAIKYIRTSFFYGRSFQSIEDVRAQAAQWLREVANQRVHATTRERPADRHLIEKTRLRALPEHPFDTDLVVPMIVSKEARVHLDTNTYSVPHSLERSQRRGPEPVHARRRRRYLCASSSIASSLPSTLGVGTGTARSSCPRTSMPCWNGVPRAAAPAAAIGLLRFRLGLRCI